jgi:hypothetical protein
LGIPVSHLPAPRADRLTRPRWLDARLLGGLLLVLISVAAGARTVSALDRRTEIWALTRDLGAGSRLAQGDLALRSVRLDGASASRYLAASTAPVGRVTLRPLGQGELLPAAALAAATSVADREVVVDVDRTAAAGLRRGQVVDVYAVRDPAGGAGAGTPAQVLSAVTIADDPDTGSSAFGAGGQVGVTLVVGQDDVARVIDAVSHGQLYVVRVPASAQTQPSPGR